MKKIILILSLIMEIGISSMFITSVANACEENTIIKTTVRAKSCNNGWYQDKYCNWYYFQEQRPLKNEWLYYNGNWYYFDNMRKMVSGKAQIIEEKVYLFSEDGTMCAKRGWISLFNTLYNFYIWYYGNGDGTVKVGEWLYENENWYYFGKLNSSTYGYGSSYGMMVSNGTEEIDEKTYLFDANGRMKYRIGWINCGPNNYIYGNGDGTVKSGEWFYYNGKWYYFMKKNGGYRDPYNGYKGCYHYYFGGQMLRGVSENIDGKVYTFDFNGGCINP